jgi:soluble lytic murein transglycosylase
LGWYNLSDFALFKPKKALSYGVNHLNYLSKYLKHPLFIAYAYNGGIGFTRKLLRDKSFFRKGKFEPYLSMERMTNIESREYGKLILVNYVIYMNQLGIKTRITPLIETLVYPSKTDKFR